MKNFSSICDNEKTWIHHSAPKLKLSLSVWTAMRKILNTNESTMKQWTKPSRICRRRRLEQNWSAAKTTVVGYEIYRKKHDFVKNYPKYRTFIRKFKKFWSSSLSSLQIDLSADIFSRCSRINSLAGRLVEKGSAASNCRLSWFVTNRTIGGYFEPAWEKRVGGDYSANCRLIWFTAMKCL